MLQTTSYALKQGEEAQITINVSSEVGGYDIEVLSASFLHIPVYNKINVTKELFNISFGPIYIQTNDSNYTLRITPTRSPGRYYRRTTIRLRVLGNMRFAELKE